jgi:hypothetical protein
VRAARRRRFSARSSLAIEAGARAHCLVKAGAIRVLGPDGGAE